MNEYLDTTTELIKYADDLLTYCIFSNMNEDTTQETVTSIERWARDNKMKLNIDKTKHMMINQVVEGPTKITLDDNPLEQISKYKYLGVILTDNMDYDEQWNKTAKTTNCHIYLIKQLKRMGFQEEVLINVYRSLTLSQYTYNAPLLISTTTQAKEEMRRQQHRFLNIVGITQEQVLIKYAIPPINVFIEQQCVNVVNRILKDPEHPITKSIPVKPYQSTRSSQHLPATTNTNSYRNSCLQVALRIRRDGYSNKYTQPRRAETTTSAYIAQVEQEKQQRKKQIKQIITNTPLQFKEKTADVTCNICSKKLNTASGLKQHITKIHTKNKQTTVTTT